MLNHLTFLETGKWAIRRKIWDYLEENNLVNVPRPCHYRIPNFEGASAANDKLLQLEAFKKANTVKVNPDKPQEQARFLVLEVCVPNVSKELFKY